MQHQILPTTCQLHVTAQFGGHVQSFELSHDATLAQLAEHLASLANANLSWPSGVSIVFDEKSKSKSPVAEHA